MSAVVAYPVQDPVVVQVRHAFQKHQHVRLDMSRRKEELRRAKLLCSPNTTAGQELHLCRFDYLLQVGRDKL
jgi:hypothetical protein